MPIKDKRQNQGAIYNTMNFNEALHSRRRRTMKEPPIRRRRIEEKLSDYKLTRINGETTRVTKMEDSTSIAHGKLHEGVPHLRYRHRQHRSRWKASWSSGLLILISIFSRHKCDAYPHQSRCFQEFVSADKNNDNVLDASEFLTALKALSDDGLFQDVPNFSGLPPIFKDKFYNIQHSWYNNNKMNAWDDTSRIKYSKRLRKPVKTNDARQRLEEACSEINNEIDNRIAIHTETSLSHTMPQRGSVNEDAMQLTQRRRLDDSTPAPTPSLQQCRIGALLSDRNRNDYINQAEYIIFVNRLSEDYWDDVTSFDGLPLELRQNYNSLAGADTETGIYIFGARQSDDADDDQMNFLIKICSDTSQSVNEVISGVVTPSKPPTSAPTPTNNDVEPTAAPSSKPVLALPQCFAAMSTSDRSPRNAKLSKEEYPTFVNVLSKRVLSFTSFDELPLLLKVNFASLADELDIIDIYGSRRNENASPEQEEYLERVCEKTFEAVLIVLNPTPTPPPAVTTTPPTVYPSAKPSVTPSVTPVTPAPVTPAPVTPIEPSSSPSISPSIKPTVQPDDTTAAPSVSPSVSPSVQPLVVTVTSTFVIFNTAGLTAEDLQSGANRDDLEAAYGTTVENTVNNKDPPEDVDVSYVPSSGVIGSIEDIQCPPAPDLSPDDLCQSVVAEFQISTNADNGSVVDFVYKEHVHEEIDSGTLEANLQNINPATPINVAEGFRGDFTTAPSLTPSSSPSVAPSVPDNEAPSTSPSISFAPSPTTQTAAPSVSPTGKTFSGPVEITANLVAKNALGPGTESLEPDTPFRIQFDSAYDLTASKITRDYNSQESTSRSLRTKYSSRRRLEVSFMNSTVGEIVDAEECPTGTDSGANCVNVYGSFFVEVTDEDADKVRFDLIKLMETSFDDGSFQEILNAVNSAHPLTVIPNARPPNRGPTPTPAPKSGGGMSVLAIVGIAVAGTMGLAALGGTLAYIHHRKGNQQAVRLEDMELEGDDLIDDNAPTMDLIEESQNDPFKDNVFPDVFNSQTEGSGGSSQEPIPVVAKKNDKRRSEVQKYDPEDFDKYGEDEDSVGSLEDFPARESVSHGFSLGDDSQSDFNEYNFDDYSEGDLEQAQKIAGRATTEEELQQARRLGGVDYSDSSSEGQSGWSTGDVNSSPDKSSNADREPDDDGSSGAPKLDADGPNLGAALGATAAGAALGAGAIATMHSDSESEDSMISDEGDSEVSGTDASESESEYESGSGSGSGSGEYSESESGESSESESGESSEESSMVSDEVSGEDSTAVSDEEGSEDSDEDGSESSEQEESLESEQENSVVSNEGDSSGSEEDVSVESKQHVSATSDQEEVTPEAESPSVEPVQASGEEQSLEEDKASSPAASFTETADKARSAPAIGGGEDKGPNIGLIAGTTAAAAAVTGAAIAAIAKKKRNSDSDSEASASLHSDSISEGKESGPSVHNSDVSGTERQTEGSHTRDLGATTQSIDGGDDGPNVGLIAGATGAAAAVTAAGLVAATRDASSKEEDSESDSEGEGFDEESESGEEEGGKRAETYLPTPYQDQEEHDERSDEFSFTESDTDTSTIESSTVELTPEEAQRRAEYRSEVETLVGIVVPDEIDNVDVMMVQFRGREAELVSTLRTMQERSVTQRARAAVHKSSKRPTRRLSRGPGSWRGNSPFSRESASSDSRGSAAGSAVIAAASVPRVTAGRPPVHMPPMPGAEREGSKADSDLSDPVFSQKQGAFQPKSFASRLSQSNGDGDNSESSESDYVPNRMDSSGSSSGSASSGSSWKSESEEGGPNAWDGRGVEQGADPQVDGKKGDSRSSKEPGMSQSAHSKGAESLGIEDLPSRWSGMPS